MKFAPYKDNQAADLFVCTHHAYKKASPEIQKELDDLVDTMFTSDSPAIQLECMQQVQNIIVTKL